MLIEIIFWLIRKPFKSNIVTRKGKNTFVFYDRFDGNSLADMLEKSTSDWIRAARKNMYYHYSAFLSTGLDLLPA